MAPDTASPLAARELHRLIKQVSSKQDPFDEVKKNSNDLVLDHYDEYKKRIDSSADPVDTALRLTIAGNILDFIACPESIEQAEEYLSSTIEKVLNTSYAHDDSGLLKQEISQSKSLLILGDNAGEIVFDKLFLEHIKHPNAFYAVREKPVINDVTLKEARYTGIDQYAYVISNGYDAPSTIPECGSPEFLRVFEQSDLIISKGQGNLEGLQDSEHKNLYFLLMVKCDMIARKLGVKKGDFVVYKNM
jgi:uncharacterized protein with ATP-grasp and redox domains